MLTFNKLFLALAFLGGSAAAQAADGNADVSRIDYGKNSEKTDRTSGIRRTQSLGNQIGSWSQGFSQQHVDHPYCVSFENVSATVNGVRLRQENLLASYDVKMPLASTAKLFDASTPARGVRHEQSLSLSESQYNYLPVHRLL
jgi:hypothetical protein